METMDFLELPDAQQAELYELLIIGDMKKQIDGFLKHIVATKTDYHQITFNKRILPCEIKGYLESLGFHIDYQCENGFRWMKCTLGNFEATLWTDRYYYGNRVLTFDLENQIKRLRQEREDDFKLASKLDGLISDLSKITQK